MMNIKLCNVCRIQRSFSGICKKITKQKANTQLILNNSVSTDNSNMSENVHTMCALNNRGSTMNNQLYNEAAMKQLIAHEFTKPALNDCINRVLAAYSNIPEKNANILRISDLGSAGGANAIELLRYVESILHKRNENRPVEYFFEDLPTSDFNVLVKTIHESKLSDQFFPMCVGRSFYEGLFPSNSIHLSLSYITLHWMRNCPGKKSLYVKDSSFLDNKLTESNSILTKDKQLHGDSNIVSRADVSRSSVDMEFILCNEVSVSPRMFQQWRASSIDDLSLFLRLRADELCDNGEGLFMMVGGGSVGGDKENKSNPYGGNRFNFINDSNGSLYKHAFENAANDLQYSEISAEIKEAQLKCYIPYFLRCETDVMESFSHVSDVLDLIDIKWDNLNLNCGSSEAAADLMWSIHGHALEESMKSSPKLVKEKSQTFHKIPYAENNYLYKKVLDAIRYHSNILFNERYPNGDLIISYMYMTVRRKRRT